MIQEDFRLRVFMTVAEQGSFTLAAKALGITQPAVSQQVTALEKSLDVQLFNRGRNEVSLTAAGKAFMQYAEKILYWYSAAGNMFGEGGRLTTAKPVRIYADEVVAAYILPKALSCVMSANPDAAFLVGTPENHDVMISASPSPETMDFEGESKIVGLMEAAVVASPLNASGRTGFSTVAGVHVSNSFAVWESYLTKLTPDLRARVSVVSQSAGLVKSMVMESDSLVGIIPAVAVSDELDDGRLARLPVSIPDFSFDVHFDPAPQFMGHPLCESLRQALSDAFSSIR